MGRGSDRLHTFWLPLHHIDIETGGVVVVEGSSSRPGFARLRETFGMQEQLVTLGQDPAELTAVRPNSRPLLPLEHWPMAAFCEPSRLPPSLPPSLPQALPDRSRGCLVGRWIRPRAG